MALSAVRERLTTTLGSVRSRRIKAVGRGVVVTRWRGLAPSRNPNWTMS